MPRTIKLTLTLDEAEIVVDALEADLEDYLEGAKEAREEGNAADAETFAEAAERIGSLLSTLRELLPEEGDAG